MYAIDILMELLFRATENQRNTYLRYIKNCTQ